MCERCDVTHVTCAGCLLMIGRAGSCMSFAAAASLSAVILSSTQSAEVHGRSLCLLWSCARAAVQDDGGGLKLQHHHVKAAVLY